MSRRGFVAMTDAMIFIVVIMMAAAVTVGYMDHVSKDDRDPSEFLEGLMDSRMRLSDMTEGDDSLVKLSDLAALHVNTGADGPREYLEEALDGFSKGRPYLLVLEFTPPGAEGDPKRSEIGHPGSMTASSATVTVPVTSGGTLHAELTLFSS